MGERSLEELLAILNDPDATDEERVEAAKEVLRRGWGERSFPVPGTDALRKLAHDDIDRMETSLASLTRC